MNATKTILMVLSMLYMAQNTSAQQTQQFHIRGQVLNGQTQLPLEDAGIILTSVSDLKNNGAKGTANKQGKFTIQAEAGKYNITISLPSFKDMILENREINQDIDLGVLLLQENYKLVETVHITTAKPDIVLDLDKKTFNVGKDLMSKGGNANDLLNNIPSVNVDASGSVSLRGNTGVRVIIDGKPSVISANNGLDQIPASHIEKIEVITNPSAKYEAQGSAGIINIVLKKNTLSGFNGAIQTGIGNPVNYNSNINLSYKKEKFNLFTNVGVRFRNLYLKEERRQVTLNEGIRNILLQNNTTNRRDQAYNIYIGGDYYINPKNTLTGSFYHSTLILNNKIDYNYDYYNANNSLDHTVYRFEYYNEPKKYNQLELNHVKTFSEKDRNWTTSLRYDFWNDDENQKITQRTTYPDQGLADNLITRNIESSNDIYIQSDYVSTKSNSKLEMGIRSDLRAIKSDYKATSNGVILSGYDNKLHYNENLFAAYTQWGNKLEKWSYLIGLRTELSLIRINDRSHSFTNNKDYINFFPTLHLGYKLQEDIDLQLSYSRRINRPEFWQLNPFGGLSDLRNLTVGNPDLDPTYTNSLEFSVLKKKSRFSITPVVYYRHTTNYFQYVLKQTPEGNFLRTPVNLDYEERYGLEISGSYKPFSWWNVALNFNYYGFKQQGQFEDKQYSSRDKMWTAQINSRMKLPKNLTIESLFSYRAGFNDIQSLNKAVYRLNVAVSKDLLKEKLTISMAFNNIFDTLIERQELNTPDYQLQSIAYGIGRVMNLTLSYRFNRNKNEKDRLPDEN